MRQSFRAYAKINVSLDITGRRENGYHDIKTIMQSVSLFDDITVENVKKGINISSDCPFLATDKRNTVYKAAELFFEKSGISDGVDIIINKRIPMGAGLGGGSADAATVLKTLNGMYNFPLSDDEILETALLCGADVPFCVLGGTYLAEGLGEVLTKLPPFPDCFIVIAKPDMSINTKAAYKAYDKLSVTEHPLTDEIISCIKNKDLNGISVRVFNVLEEAAKGRYKELNRFKGIMLESGALGSAMTGSGSAVFGIFNNRSCAYNAKKRFLKRGVSSFVTQPVGRK